MRELNDEQNQVLRFVFYSEMGANDFTYYMNI